MGLTLRYNLFYSDAESVYDAFFDCGEALDHYVQQRLAEPIGFPGEDYRGNPRVIAKHLPFLRVEDVEPYLVQREWDIDLVPAGVNAPARPGDEFERVDECAVLDFLRMLGVAIERRGHFVQLKGPKYRSMRLPGTA